MIGRGRLLSCAGGLPLVTPDGMTDAIGVASPAPSLVSHMIRKRSLAAA